MRCARGSTRSRRSRPRRRSPPPDRLVHSFARGHAVDRLALRRRAGQVVVMLDTDEDRDDAAPIDMLESYFSAHGWEHERLDDEVIAKVKGSWTTYELRALWRDEDAVLQFLAFPDVRVTDERRAAVYEAIGLINEQLWVGHFELWSSSGILLYRHAAMIDGEGGTLSLAGAELLVESAIDECERFYPVFQFVMWGGKTPKEALAAAMTETQGEA